ncbi:glycosyltransferase [Cytobacillus purgationiresistens]|uniref:Glycosyltransferase involved in cell wall biosynthesis n=1 Tax=Cytobacillus purgationiresistens TaxID=863449 RepID=A0ABU0ACY6_9BACI|nr:glycosyltransferase [Cytobacillus purgationiresistens]MDQ0269108.1 glycosyltransferase involved in cell wall biosynthesis [Cytobacillus purgationiresistens]
MKVLHLNAGNETGGGMFHILDLLETLDPTTFILGVFESGPMFEEAVKRGIKVHLFQTKRRWDFSVVYKIIDFIKEEKVTMLHTHGARANCFGYFLKQKHRECSWITTVHSNPHDDFLQKGLKGRFFTQLHLWALKRPDYYFAISNRFKDMLVSQGVQENKVTTIFNGIDFSKREPSTIVKRSDLNLSEKDFVIAMVARLTPVKGHTTALMALKEIVTDYPHVKLLLIGDGFLEWELKKRVEELELTDQVSFLGYRKDVDALLQISDLKLLTSYSESFPLVLLEAARAKNAIITTDVGGVRDLIPSQEFGWVIPVKDHFALTVALVEAIEQQATGELAEKGERLYERASALFTVEHFRENVIKAYKKWV